MTYNDPDDNFPEVYFAYMIFLFTGVIIGALLTQFFI